MADPTAYNVSYSFSGWQAINPNLPLPADEVDSELANIETSIDSLVTALADVRRSDGTIQNGIVTLDSLDAQVQAALGDHDILTSDLSPAAFATQASAEGGVANDKIMTPLSTKQAVDSYRAFAEQAAAQAGVQTTTVMSPLRTAEAIVAQRPIASQAEAEAGALNTKVMTPLRVSQEITALRPALTASQAFTWGAITTLASTTQTIAVPGAVVGDRVVVGLPVGGLQAGIMVTPWVSASDVVSIRLYNSTTGSLTPTAAATWSVSVLHF